MIEIREAGAGELAALAEMTAEAYSLHGVGDDYLAEIRNIAPRAADAVVLVAVDDGGRLAGGLTYVPGPGPYATFDDDDEAGIRMLVVAPEHRRRGVGRALVKACLQRARADGRARVSLHTMTSMTAAQQLYRSLGFRRAPETDLWPVPEVQLRGYVLDLQAVASPHRPGGGTGKTRGA